MSYLHDASPQALDRFAVLIPAWQPEAQLLTLTTSLLDHGFGNVIGPLLACSYQARLFFASWKSGRNRSASCSLRIASSHCRSAP